MSKFKTAATLAPRSYANTPNMTLTNPDTQTAEGGPGWSRDAKSELFLLAVTNMVTEDTFYEKAQARDDRFTQLIHQVAAEDPDWLARLVPYMRNTMNMRSASIVLAAETVKEKLGLAAALARGSTIDEKATDRLPGKVHARDIISSALQRADEPAEMLGYWRTKYGRAIPKPVKRGVADAVARLYNERAYVKYGAGEGYRMADVLDIVHPDPKATWQSALFKFMLDERHGRDTEAQLQAHEELLSTVRANRVAMGLTTDEFRTAFSIPEFVRDAGLTWEQASSKYGKLDHAFWEAMVPNMGIFALVRNLRNFDDAGVSQATRDAVVAKLTDAVAVARSRMFPLRFYAAFREVKTLYWHQALEQALNLSLTNVPALKGKTLILVDTSGSMDDKLSTRGSLSRQEAACLFGAALALRANNPTLVSFNTASREVFARPGGSVLKLSEELRRLPSESGGTETWAALAKHFGGHDRVILVTDEQAWSTGWHGYFSNSRPPAPAMEQVLKSVPTYTFNLAGYRAAHLPSGDRRYTFGGLTDAGFTAIELLEAGTDAGWPF